jgi:hypothetical protein
LPLLHPSLAGSMPHHKYQLPLTTKSLFLFSIAN